MCLTLRANTSVYYSLLQHVHSCFYHETNSYSSVSLFSLHFYLTTSFLKTHTKYREGLWLIKTPSDPSSSQLILLHTISYWAYSIFSSNPKYVITQVQFYDTPLSVLHIFRIWETNPILKTVWNLKKIYLWLRTWGPQKVFYFRYLWRPPSTQGHVHSVLLVSPLQIHAHTCCSRWPKIFYGVKHRRGKEVMGKERIH